MVNGIIISIPTEELYIWRFFLNCSRLEIWHVIHRTTIAKSHLLGDQIIRNQTTYPIEALLQQPDLVGQHIRRALHLNILRRVGRQTCAIQIQIGFLHNINPVTYILLFQCLNFRPHSFVGNGSGCRHPVEHDGYEVTESLVALAQGHRTTLRR